MKTLDKSKLEEGYDREEDDVESEIVCGWETEFKALPAAFILTRTWTQAEQEPCDGENRKVDRLSWGRLSKFQVEPIEKTNATELSKLYNIWSKIST